jgi:tetratricopeptide (TPR) repeat protein
VAHHFSEGEDWARDFEYLVRSGARARDAYANQTALDFYARALDAAKRATPAVPPARVMEVLRRRGRLLSVLARLPEAIADLEQMMAVARGTGDRRGEGQAAAELGAVHHATFAAEHVPEVKRMAELAHAIATETGDQNVLSRSLYLLAMGCQIAGDLRPADARLEESLRISEANGSRMLSLPTSPTSGCTRTGAENSGGR